MKRLVFALVLACACVGCKSVTKEHVEADRKFLDSVGKDYLRYVDGDQTLDADQKQLRHSTVETFRIHVQEAEKEAK